MATLKLTSMVTMLYMVMLTAPMTEAAAISCGQVTDALAPCLTYLQKGGTRAPSPECCAGVRRLNAAAQTTPERQATCNCVKTTAASIRGLNTANAQALPTKCGANIPYNISPSTNCATIKY